MNNIDVEVLNIFDSFGAASVGSGSLISRLCNEGFEVPDIVGTLYDLVDRGLLSIDITGRIQRPKLDGRA